MKEPTTNGKTFYHGDAPYLESGGDLSRGFDVIAIKHRFSGTTLCDFDVSTVHSNGIHFFITRSKRRTTEMNFETACATIAMLLWAFGESIADVVTNFVIGM